MICLKKKGAAFDDQTTVQQSTYKITDTKMLDTVGERGVGVRSDMSQFSRLPDAPIKEEGTVPKLFRKYENLYGDLSDGT